MNLKPETKIGQMNGWWAFLLRIALATYPFVIGWGCWVTGMTLDMRNVMHQVERNRVIVQEVRDELMRRASTVAEVTDLKKEIITLQIKVQHLTTLLERREAP